MRNPTNSVVKMDLVTRNAGSFLFLGGLIVLIGYFVQYNVIRNKHAEFLSNKNRWTFRIWFTFAFFAAVGYLSLFVLWIQTDTFESSSGLFLSGLATFIFGACLWPWVFTDRYAETSAIWITAIGSIIILAAVIMTGSKDKITMGIGPAIALVVQHVIIDGMLWTNSEYRAGTIDETKMEKHVVKALYQAYYAPLFVAVVLLLVDEWYSDVAAIIAATVTSLHFLVGAVVALRKPSVLEVVRNRYNNPTTVFADASISFALALAVYVLYTGERWLIFPAIVLAIIGNTFCLADQVDYNVSLRSGWIGVILVWVWFAILSKMWGYVLSVTVSGSIILTADIMLYKFWTRLKKKDIVFGHFVAGVFHALSSVVLSIVVWALDRSWRAPMTRFVTSWDHPNNTGAITEVDCTAKPCYMRIDIKVLQERLPLVDFVVAASCISASYHFLIVYRIIKEEKKAEKEKTTPNYRSIFPLRWSDYSMSASLLLVVISALCGVSDIFLLVVPPLVVYILLDATPRLEEDWKKPDRPRARFFSYIVFYLLAWTPTVYQFYTSWEEDPKPPDAIVAIIFTLFFVYSGFIINFVEKDESTKEKRYILLSFLAKTTLHWLLYSGISGRSDRVYATEEEAVTADGSGNEAPWWELLLSIAGPVVLGGFGYYYTSAEIEAVAEDKKEEELKLIEDEENDLRNRRVGILMKPLNNYL